MLLIGLAGGKPASRREIAERLVSFARSGFVICEMPASPRAAVRVAYLADFMRNIEQNRAVGGVVVRDVMTEHEAEEIYRRGGEMWHVMGPPSESVPMHLKDRKVTHMQGGCRHFLDAMEAFSEAMLDALRAV